MVPLIPELRKLLENRIPEARQAAEDAARAILETLAVNRPEPFASMTPEQRRLRNALRARARQLGNGSQTDGFEPLVEEAAYFQWHRMVFARFLAENNLLMHPSNVPVTLQDCAELAQEEGEVDGWAVAAKYTSLMLPGIFRPEDPEVQLRLAPEGQQKLENILIKLHASIFWADDSLGWMYQFWQSRKKEEIKKSEKKIGGASIAPVTQLFTEDYMVRFLLENSLGAWWATRHPESPLIKEWEYLRTNEDGSPVGGNYSSWPEKSAEVTVMDPCCGSGHFLVVAFDMLWKMRIEEEGLIGTEALSSVIRENIYGLEIDPRCTQIAIFALALIAWKCNGFCTLPSFNIICTGLPVKGQIAEWTSLSGNDSELKRALFQLNNLFSTASDLGSLIDPIYSKEGPLFAENYYNIQLELKNILQSQSNIDDQTPLLFGEFAKNTLLASDLLSRKYTLVTTNVPYLTSGKQNEELRKYCEEVYPEAKADLATVFASRIKKFVKPGGTYAVVMPKNWHFLDSYEEFRRSLLREQTLAINIDLGNKAFKTAMWDFHVGLFIIHNSIPSPKEFIYGLKVSQSSKQDEKVQLLKKGTFSLVSQKELSKNNKSIITLEILKRGPKLSDYASVFRGSFPGQTPRVTRYFWEVDKINSDVWSFMESSPTGKAQYSGKAEIALSLSKIREYKIVEFGLRGEKAFGKRGLIVSKMNTLPSCVYCGEFFDDNTYVLIPKSNDYLPAIFHFLRSKTYLDEVRKINQKLAITTVAMIDVPFDFDFWYEYVKTQEPIAPPWSNDPTQWLFQGILTNSTDSLQAALIRLLGYLWPKQSKTSHHSFIFDNGILCLHLVSGELAGADRLRSFLAEEYGKDWSPMKQKNLLIQAGSSQETIEEWLKNEFFIQHCKLFHNRPFIWHIWDGRKDGFSALVNYHKLTKTNLERLIYSYLGDWINFQRGRRDHGEPGADGRLVAALALQEKLKLILEGEPPYDIYVRWKSLAEQPIGWDPDLNDGVRLNIRPFVTAGILRSKFTINWKNDRGKNPDGSERVNDLHFTRAEKLEARRKAGK